MTDPLIYPHELTGPTIRLLTVEPDEPSAPLRCQLSETCLDTTPTTYHALSYCWGANQSPAQIICNSRPLSVTPNLHSMLLEYRRRRAITPLWVDAICINQSNLSERTSQVRMMDRIYAEAECVVVWLGEAEETDKNALLLLRWIHEMKIPNLAKFRNAKECDAYLSQTLPEEYLTALAAFLLRPWFSRIWIIQEVVLASQVLFWCGPVTLDKEFPLLDAIKQSMKMTVFWVKLGTAPCASEYDDGGSVPRSKHLSAARIFAIKDSRERGTNGILDLVMLTPRSEATDPRDKVFALVGLASDIDNSFVDYSKSYKDLMRELSSMVLNGKIRPPTGNVLDVWSLITRAENDAITYPSWVVDLSKLKSDIYLPMISADSSRRPGTNREPEIQFPDGEGKQFLCIRGTIHDTIAETASNPILWYDILNRRDYSKNSWFLSVWHDWLHRAQELTQRTGCVDSNGIYRPTGEPVNEAVWRTLCCDTIISPGLKRPADGSSYDAFLTHIDGLKIAEDYMHLGLGCFASTTALTLFLFYYFRRRNWFLRFVLPLAGAFFVQSIYIGRAIEKTKELADIRKKLIIDERDFAKSHFMWMQGRKFGITRSGLIGLVPISARVGDHVGFFAGCRIQYVLRKVEEGYGIVGDSYLHGVMNDEGDKYDTEMLTIV